jgi:N6-L-threonylcarbamoyladenine synthase
VRLVTPDAKYCTDNGLMIAWNGLEKFRRKLDLVPPEDVFGDKMAIEPRAKFGVDISDQVIDSNIKCSWIKIK